MNTNSLADQIVAFVNSPEFRPCKPRVLLRQMKLSEEDYRALRMAIKKLVREGRVTFGANHLVMPPVAGRPFKTERASSEEPKPRGKSKEVVGVFRYVASGGYGFVVVNKTAEHEATDDVFIPPTARGNAMDGDTVRIRLKRPDSMGRLEGQIEEILGRGKREFAGTFHLDNGKASVWVDGAKLEKPVTVGDVRGLPLEENDKVIIEMVRYPDELHAGEAVILKVLGSMKNPAVDTMAVMLQFGLPEEFPEEVLEDARRQADRFDEETIPEGRRDLTQVPTITIDPFDARDFDDAISLTKNEKGNWELQVHIADVAFFVPEGGRLDEEARQRGTSVYLPDRVIPMLPETISNHLASLQPDKKRLAKTVFMEYTTDGMLVHKEVFNSVIKNAYRFNYEQIDQYLADRELWRDRLSPVIFELVADMHTFAMMLRRLRKENGSIELTLPEVKIDLDKSGKVKGAHVVQYTESHQVIEEFMLAANQAVASWLDDLQLPFLRRAHAPPDRMKIRRLNDFARALGIQAGDLEDRFEIQRVVDSIRGQTVEYAVNYAILKSMSKAVYQCDFERHYALNMTHYCHFTSPIRRYPDLTVHRIIQKLIEGVPAKENPEVLEMLGQQCSNAEQNAESAERELIRVKLLHFMERKIGEPMSGVVAGVRPNGLTVRGIEIPIDGFLPLEALPSDRYRFDRDTHTLEGFRSGNRFRLGDELIVRIDRVDLMKRQLLLRLEKVTHHAPSIHVEKRAKGKKEAGHKGRFAKPLTSKGHAKSKKKKRKR